MCARRGWLLLLVWLAGCASRRVETVETASTSSGEVVIVEATGSAYVEGSSSVGASGTCGAMLRVFDVRIPAGCVIDERVTAAPGRLVYPCAGGPATATFGASVFQGSVSPAGEVELEIRTEFRFSDGCDWETKQSLTGNLGTGALGYEYREGPMPGQRGCAAACVGTASVTVSPG